MPSDRRYDEKQIAAIFEQAAHAQEAAQQQTGGGLTLAELQEIGASAGIDPAFIRRAAAVVDHTPKTLDAPTLLGIPVGVGRTIDLPGDFTDDDWERLVVDVRQTFRAKGRIEQHGNLRQWSNGNLHVLVEPTATGHRVRFRTRNANVQGKITGGGIALLVAATMLLLVLFGLNGTIGEPGGVSTWAFPMLFAIWALGSSYFELPAWRRTRAQQMEALAARLVEAHVPLPPEGVFEEDMLAAMPEGRIDLDELPPDDSLVSAPRRTRT